VGFAVADGRRNVVAVEVESHRASWPSPSLRRPDPRG
jgi:hypothetical protein